MNCILQSQSAREKGSLIILAPSLILQMRELRPKDLLKIPLLVGSHNLCPGFASETSVPLENELTEEKGGKYLRRKGV